MSFLNDRMGIDLKLKILTYGNVIKKGKNGVGYGAFLKSFVYVMVISQLGAEPLARSINMGGTSTYEEFIITRKE